MNRIEINERIKHIIVLIDNAIYDVDADSITIDEVFKKIEDLNWCLEENFMSIDSFDAEDMKADILIEYIDNSSIIEEFIDEISNLKEEIYDEFTEMKEGSNRREEWEEFYYNLEDCEPNLDVHDAEIYDIEALKDKLEEAKTDLENLI